MIKESRSQLKDIECGLVDLVDVIQERGIASIAVPPLGCGNGGLNWRDVEPRIVAAFEQIPDVDVLLFAPEGAPAAAEIGTATKRPQMTPGRTALVELVHRYTLQSFMAPGLVESQKLMYFMQVAGEPLRLNFAANRYGPYADNLRHVLNIVEGHFLSGYGDGSATVAKAEPLAVLPGATQEAELALKDAGVTRDRIERVLDLAAGFEYAYGLELLSTVHWLATHGPSVDDEALTKQVWEWSPRKATMFTADHVLTALAALRSLEWLPEAADA